MSRDYSDIYQWNRNATGRETEEQYLLGKIDDAEGDLETFKRVVLGGGTLMVLETLGIVVVQLFLSGDTCGWLTALGAVLLIATFIVAVFWASLFVDEKGSITPAREARVMQRRLDAYYLAQFEDGK